MSSEVNNRADRKALDRIPHQRAIAYITDDQWSPFDRPRVSGAQIVQHDWRVTGGVQSLTGMTTDVSCTACDQDVRAHGVWMGRSICAEPPRSDRTSNLFYTI